MNIQKSLKIVPTEVAIKVNYTYYNKYVFKFFLSK